MRPRAVEAAVLLATLALLAAAPAPRSGTGVKLRTPTGPFTITAEYAEGALTGVMQYRGNVRLVSKTLEIRGDHMQLRQPAKGEFEADVTGSPARLNHSGDKDLPAVSARASAIHY